MHSGGKKYLPCNATPTRRAPRLNQELEQYHPGNADTDLRTGSAGTSQFSPYQFQLSSHITIGTDNCYNELHASVA